MPNLISKRPEGSTTTAAPTAMDKAEWVGQVYVNRRKVWEQRYASKDEAFNNAKQEQQKYEKQNSIIVVRKSK